MRAKIGIAALIASFAAMLAAEVSAHPLPWRTGEPRQAAFGRCAKGACTSRAVWSASRQHRHVKGKIVLVSRPG